MLNDKQLQQRLAFMNTGTSFKRIVSLAPSITETLFALGAGNRLVGRTRQCDWPEQIKSIHIVGDFSAVTIKDIFEVEPDLVLGTTLHTQIMEQVKEHGIAAAAIPPYPAHQAPQAIRYIQKNINTTGSRTELADRLEMEINLIGESAQKLIPKTVCYLCNIACPSWYCCSIAASIEFLNCTVAGRSGSPDTSTSDIVEKIVDDGPGIVMSPQCSRCRVQCINPLLSEDNQLSRYIAQNNIPVVTLNSTLLARSGPRAALALRELGAMIHGLQWKLAGEKD